MAKRKKKNELGGILIGPLMVFAALGALWKNETRYDYYRAAKHATEIKSLQDADEDQVVAYSGSMDSALSLDDKYIQSFTGFLVVQRSAEIYCWDRDDDDDGVDWSLRWMSSIENNSRNNGLAQHLKSGRLIPPSYTIGDLDVQTNQIEFVDSFTNIMTRGLERTGDPFAGKLQSEGNYLNLKKGAARNLGDERMSYRGIPIPTTATYFGKFENGKGVAHDAEKRTGWVSSMIQDSGVLHHVVAGERETALATIKAYLSRLKWIIRGIGTAVTILGFVLLFSSMVRFLFRVPVIGWFAEKGAILLGILVGLPLALVTIASGYLFGHLFVLLGLIGFLGAIGVVLVRARRNSKASQAEFHQALEQEFGRPLNRNDIKEMEFAELAHLALSDSKLNDDETAFLYKWGKRNGFERERCSELLAQVKEARELPGTKRTSDEHLNQLIKLALADSELSPYELRTIRSAAERAGYDKQTVRELMDHVQQAI